MFYQQFVRFTGDAGGVEKILRFCQSISQIGAAYAFSVDAVVFWMHLRRQFALGRRYLRFFKFISCFQRCHDNFIFPLTTSRILEVMRWMFMGSYLGLETITILDAMGVYPTPLAEHLMLHANKFWFYSLLCSITLHLFALQHQSSSRPVIASLNGAIQSRQSTRNLRDDSIKGTKRRLLSDSADLLIPGHVTGWIKTSMGIVGIASVISTVLCGKEIWDSYAIPRGDDGSVKMQLMRSDVAVPVIFVTPSPGRKSRAKDRSASRTPSRSPRRM